MSRNQTERQKAVENSVKMIALARKICEMADESVEEFDKELNELCDKWHTKFANMDAADLARFMLSDLVDQIMEEGE